LVLGRQALSSSFLNVVICRLPVMLEKHWREALLQLSLPSSEPTARFNLVPHSRCPYCHTPVAAG
jgi:general secretion pathway protein O